MSDPEDLRDLTTEDQNPASTGLDTKSALEIARIINLEDAKVAVKKAAALEPVIGQVFFAPECHAAYARLEALLRRRRAQPSRGRLH